MLEPKFCDRTTGPEFEQSEIAMEFFKKAKPVMGSQNGLSLNHQLTRSQDIQNECEADAE